MINYQYDNNIKHNIQLVIKFTTIEMNGS